MARSKKEAMSNDSAYWFDQLRAHFDRPFLWQQAQWQVVVGQAQSDRQSQAYLLHGPEGTGKRLFVHWWLKWSYCRNVQDIAVQNTSIQKTSIQNTSVQNSSAPTQNPVVSVRACGRCGDCAQIVAGTHADVLWLRPEEGSKSIKIDQIRQVISFSQHTAKRSGLRTVVIEPAQAMPVAAQNALLKTLEEPGAKTQLLLVADQAQSLLPTVASRTQRLAFGMPLKAQVKDWLLQLPPSLLPDGVNAKLAFDQLDCVQGAPIRLLQYLHDPWAKARPELIEALKALSKSPNSFSSLINQWSQWPLAERLVTVIDLMQATLREGVRVVCRTRSNSVAGLDGAFGCYDECMALCRKVQQSLSLNEPLVWENALIHLHKFYSFMNEQGLEPKSKG